MVLEENGTGEDVHTRLNDSHGRGQKIRVKDSVRERKNFLPLLHLNAHYAHCVW